MNSLLCNWFTDWGRAIKSGLGTAGVIVFLVIYSCIALLLTYSIFKATINKAKLVIKWGQIILLIIFVLLIIWFSIIL